MIIIEIKFSFDQREYGGVAAAVVFLLFLPFYVVFVEEYRVWKDNKSSSSSSSSSLSLAQNSAPAGPEMSISREEIVCKWNQNVFNPPEIGEDHTILQALFSAEMLTLFLTTMCGLGGTLSMMDNLGQIGTSLGYSLDSIATFVSLTSIWIFLGEVLAGTISEILIKRYKCPRPLMFTITLLLSCLGYLLIAFNVRNGLYLASIIIGFCFGAQWPLLFSVVSEIFGLKHYSTLYNISAMANPSGLYLLNVKVTGFFYDREAMRQLRALGHERKAGEQLSCNGGECYRLSFLIITGVTVFGALVSIVLVLRTRKFYRSDIYKRFTKREVASLTEESVMEITDMDAGVGLTGKC
ncbi:Major facilitator [Trema orientale]|uniref:Major facilitator n=1 Tax=Trema orientale TaxID=63057 RepID=A0A2P5FLM2_TREOI|nr:Major facilitator [Trema orientale]